MLKVVIVDDEALVRVGLKSMLEWENLGYMLAGEASNGQQGLEMIVASQPDIVITDIKMPVMDGLEMIRKASDFCSSIKFIVLSSFDEFHLVKQAMKMGVEEYLIKLELEPETLKGTLTQIREKILAEREEDDKRKRLERHLRVNKPIMREEFFKKLIGKFLLSQEEIDETKAYLEIDLFEERLFCVTIKVHDMHNMDQFENEDLQLFNFSVINIVDEIANDLFKGYSFKFNTGEYAAILSLENGMEDLAFKAKTDEMAERLIQMLKQYFNISVSIGVSCLCSGLKQIAKAYSESYEAVQNSFFKGSGKVIYYSEINPQTVGEANIVISNIKDNLLKAVQTNDIEAVQIIFDEIVNTFECFRISREKAYDLCCQVGYLISGNIDLEEEELKEVLGYDTSLYDNISKLSTLAEIIHWMRMLQRGLCLLLTKNDEQGTNRLVAKARKYIHEHYTEDINLNDIASMFSISPGYFSTIFKQNTGMCFTDYVAEVKIAEAKKLLRESNYKIYEISEMLGYENAYYFSRVFKKITGMTPSEFLSKKY